jgi:hypothetical protein
LWYSSIKTWGGCQSYVYAGSSAYRVSKQLNTQVPDTGQVSRPHYQFDSFNVTVISVQNANSQAVVNNKIKEHRVARITAALWFAHICVVRLREEDKSSKTRVSRFCTKEMTGKDKVRR